MVTLTKLNGDVIVINSDLIEFIERTPDCLISMTTGRKLMVREPLEDVQAKLQEFHVGRKGAYPVPAGGEGYQPQDVESRFSEQRQDD